MQNRVAAGLRILVAAAFMAACQDQSSVLSPERGSPAAAPPAAATLDRGGSAEWAVLPLRRTTPVNGVSWSFVATTAGTVSRNGPSGLTVIVPAGALRADTPITVTAVDGDLVAYAFEPHGLHFRLPVLLVQDLRGVANRPQGDNPVIGGYFPGAAPQVDHRTHKASISELELTYTSDRTNSAVMFVGHFSGYIFASGRSIN